jgi:hypothetical protein
LLQKKRGVSGDSEPLLKKDKQNALIGSFPYMGYLILVDLSNAETALAKARCLMDEMKAGCHIRLIGNKFGELNYHIFLFCNFRFVW